MKIHGYLEGQERRFRQQLAVILYDADKGDNGNGDAAVIDKRISHNRRRAAVFDFLFPMHGLPILKDLVIERFFIMGKDGPRFGQFILPPLLQERRPVGSQYQRPLTLAGT